MFYEDVMEQAFEVGRQAGVVNDPIAELAFKLDRFGENFDPYEYMDQVDIPIVGIDLHDWGHEGSGPHLSVVEWKESGYEGSRPGKYFCLDQFFFFTLFGVKFGAVCTLSLIHISKRVDWSIYKPLMLPTCCLARTMWWQSSIITSHNGDCSITCLPVTSKKHIRI